MYKSNVCVTIKQMFVNDSGCHKIDLSATNLQVFIFMINF